MPDRSDCVKRDVCIKASKGGVIICDGCQHYIPRPDSVKGNNNIRRKKMDNDLSNLADHLFKQLDRLDSADGADEISQEKDRSQAMVNVASVIVDTASLTLKAHMELNTGKPKPTPKLLGA